MATKSRFFAGSSSESENESDKDSGSSDENPITQRQAAGRFATYDESDSGEFCIKFLNCSSVNNSFYYLIFYYC